MADRRDRLLRRGEMPDGLDHIRVQPDVLRRSAAGNDQRVVILGLDVGKGGVEREVVARFLAVGLIPLEIVNRRADFLSRLLSGQTACTVWPTMSSA